MRLPCLRLQNVYWTPAELVREGAVTPDSSDRDGDMDDRMREKWKTEKKSVGLQTKPKKSLDQKNLTPKISRDLFPSQKIFPESVKNPKKVRTCKNLQVMGSWYLPKFSYPPPPQKSRNRKFQTPEDPSIIPVTWNPKWSPPPPPHPGAPRVSFSAALAGVTQCSPRADPVGTRLHGARGSGVTTALLSARKVE